MREPKYSIAELRTALDDVDLGWSYKDREEEDLSFFGEIYEVKASNKLLTKPEILGQIIENKFIAEEEAYSAQIDVRMGKVNAVAVNCKDGVAIIPKERIYVQNGKRIEGYWYSEREPQYPMPIPGELQEEEAQEIYALIKAKEKESEVRYSRGFSTSRIDNTILGTNEFEQENWQWPEDFAEHYVLKYKVKPSNDFLMFIAWKKPL